MALIVLFVISANNTGNGAVKIITALDYNTNKERNRAPVYVFCFCALGASDTSEINTNQI